MRKILVSILLMFAFLGITTPASAAQKVRVGAGISLFTGPTTFAAGSPFHIAHGWLTNSSLDAIGIYDFELEVDNVVRVEDFIERSAISGDPDLLARIWVYNFPNGMTGTHTFRGHWYGPCQNLVNDGFYSGTCSNPTARVEANVILLPQTLTVTFGP
jgi:hypothetical protein